MMSEKEHRITLRLPEDLYTEVENYCRITGMSITEFLRRACRDKLMRTDYSAGEVPAEYVRVPDKNKLEVELRGEKISISCEDVNTLIQAAAAIANSTVSANEIKQQGIGNKMEITR